MNGLTSPTPWRIVSISIFSKPETHGSRKGKDMVDAIQAAQIARLNDDFRTTLRGGRILLTSGVMSLPSETLNALFTVIQNYNFDALASGQESHEERDFGAFQLNGQGFFWNIDYCDPTCSFASENPANPAQTTRVLTVMLADERVMDYFTVNPEQIGKPLD